MRESSLCCQTCDGGALTTQNEGPGFISTMEITPQKRFCDSRFGSVSHTPVLSELIDNQQSMSSEQGSPFKFLWQFRYPFAYWDNRLEKINPYNEQDRLRRCTRSFSLQISMHTYSQPMFETLNSPGSSSKRTLSEGYRRGLGQVADRRNGNSRNAFGEPRRVGHV